MRPVLDVEETRRLDGEAETSVDVLMDRAGFGVALAGVEMGAGYGTRVAVLAGSGNNGGDGYVAARYLSARGAQVTVYALGPPKPGTAASAAAARAVAAGVAIADLDEPRPADLLIDALFGVGFRGELPAAATGWMGLDIPTLAVDVPSGLDADSGRVAGRAIDADRTVTFHSLKPGHLLGEGPEVCGEVSVVDIGLHGGDPTFRLCEAVDAPRPRRRRTAHKWSAGSVAVVGGAPGMSGAPLLAARSALAMGAGAVALVVPGALASSYVAWPDIMTKPIGDGDRFAAADAGSVLVETERYDVMVLGPGLGPSQSGLVGRLVAEWGGPLLIDADGLNALDGLDAVAARDAPTVITPHAGEFERLTGRPAHAAAAMTVPDDAGVVVLLKGNPTVIAGTEPWLVSTGGPELATIGTGDVLAGAVGALWARGLDAEVATRSAAYWHGLAGAVLKPRGSVTASELTAELAHYAFA